MNSGKNLWIPLAALTLIVCQDKSPSPAAGQRTLGGHIVAYRPGDRVIQVVSHVINVEKLLFKVNPPNNDGHPEVIKLEYLHMGYSEISDGDLDGSRSLMVTAMRKPDCDESFSHYLTSAPRPRDERGKSQRDSQFQTVVFTGGTKQSDFSPESRLECYVVERGKIEPSKD
jgi:hypothetical protein